MEASALTHASQRGLLARRSPLLKLQGDAKLIAMARGGNPGAFETIVDRYQPRLLGFCRQMLGSTHDAEDVLQEVFVNAYKAMLADEREINLRPWLYRIARNRCLNHLRKPTADAQESMDMVPVVEAASTAEKVSNREEFRQLLDDVGKLPETQRSALLLREMDAMSYEEIAATMETSVPSVKSLLVRARISLAEASQARQLTCGEVRLALAEAAEGLRKASGPVRRHVRDCDECADFRAQVRTNEKVMAALAPTGALIALKGFIVSKLGLGGSAGGATGGASATGVGAGAGAGATAATGAAGAAGAGAGAAGVSAAAAGAAVGGAGAAGGIGAVGGALGTKAVAGVVTAAVLTAGAVEVKQKTTAPPAVAPVVAQRSSLPKRPVVAAAPIVAIEAEAPAPVPVETPPPVAEPEPEPAPVAEPTAGEGAAIPTEEATSEEPVAKATMPKLTAAKPQHSSSGAHGDSETIVVTVGGTVPPSQPTESTPPPAQTTPPPSSTQPPPAESTPPTGGSSGSSDTEDSTTPTPPPPAE